MTEKMATYNNGPVQQLKQETKAEDQISVKSETPARIEDIFDWIDGLPLSKATKNLARDFSDAVLMSEILKFYYPHLVSTHHYLPVNGVQSKKDNWRMLNKKVLSKIDLRLSAETIDQLAHSQVGVIEKVLADFREKQMALKENFDPLLKQEFNLSGEPSLASVHNRAVSEQEPSDYFHSVGRSFYAFLGMVMRVVCFWRWFERGAPPVEAKPNKDPSNTQIPDESGPATEAQLRESYAHAVQELQTKIDVVKTLCHKVAFLEGTMKLKDTKIASLMSQLEQAQAAAQSRDNQAHSQAAAAAGPEAPYPRPPNTATISSSLKARPKRPRAQA